LEKVVINWGLCCISEHVCCQAWWQDRYEKRGAQRGRKGPWMQWLRRT
jgi:hypothetical protein